MRSLIMFMSLFAGLSSRSLAGNENSGGGGAFLCQDSGSRTTQLLDLWEATNIYHFPVAFSNESAEVQFNRVVDRLGSFDSQLPQKIKEIAKTLFANKSFLNNGVRLSPPQDANNAYLPTNCQLVGMMFYDGGVQHLVIDNEYFSLLRTQTDIAAAVLHEAYYYLSRNMNSNNHFHYTFLDDSNYVRKFVGCAFSSNTTCFGTVTKKTIKNLSKSTKHCSGPNSDIDIYYSDSGFTTQQIPFLGGYVGSVKKNSLTVVNKAFGRVFNEPLVINDDSSAASYGAMNSELNQFGYNLIAFSIGQFVGNPDKALLMSADGKNYQDRMTCH